MSSQYWFESANRLMAKADAAGLQGTDLDPILEIAAKNLGFAWSALYTEVCFERANQLERLKIQNEKARQQHLSRRANFDGKNLDGCTCPWCVDSRS